MLATYWVMTGRGETVEDLILAVKNSRYNVPLTLYCMPQSARTNLAIKPGIPISPEDIRRMTVCDYERHYKKEDIKTYPLS